MPGMDGTGPFGDPKWNCRRSYGAGAAFRGGMGFGRGAGRGFGWKNQQGSTATEPIALTKAEEKKILEAQLKETEAEKSAIEQKLKEMK